MKYMRFSLIILLLAYKVDSLLGFKMLEAIGSILLKITAPDAIYYVATYTCACALLAWSCA